MITLFCADPLNPRQPDSSFENEAAVAARLGMTYSLIDFEALVYENDPVKSIRKVTVATLSGLACYRGWMLTPAMYELLYIALADRGVHLINSPSAYRHCHYLPQSYSIIKGHTPQSVWVKTIGQLPPEHLADLLAPFGDRPLILKDYVKSRKHEWHEACFIPRASDQAAVQRVVNRFLELQGSDLNEGLVFREYVDLVPLATHAKSGMPLTLEYRIFYLDGEPIVTTSYWSEYDYPGITPPLDQFQTIARSVESRFFTMDVAKLICGEWTIVELGDAQVAELAENANTEAFYRKLAAMRV